MSDDESDYYSDSTEEYEVDTLKIVNKKPNITLNAAKKFGNYVEDESDVDDSELDDADHDDDDNDDDADLDENIQIGGVEDDPEEDYHDSEIDADDADKDDSVADDDVDESDIEIDEDGEVIEKKPLSKISKPKKTTQLIIEDDDDDEDEYEENYLQKFDADVNKNYIYEFHPECLNHNSDEVEKLAKVIRDETNTIIDPLHKTLPYLTKYEKARVLGQRAKQIEVGAKPLVKIPENIIDGYIIAELELREKKIPFIIKRPIPGGAFEYWHLRDLENINF